MPDGDLTPLGAQFNPIGSTPKQENSYKVDHDAAISLAVGVSGRNTEVAVKMKAHAGVVDELANVLASRRGESSANAFSGRDINQTLAERAKMMKSRRAQKFD